jgi:L,D-peptidoglycan transpeptidase YkuD (ErfK/YbiS/YcfS/YnhG family)
VIAYNVARTPGRGSAIFVHVTTGAPTHGCVALGRVELDRLLTWLDPRDRPRVDIGTAAMIARG